MLVGMSSFVALLAISARMVWLTVFMGETLEEDLNRITCPEYVDMSYRGPILDRTGTALATSIPAYRVSRSGRDYEYDALHAKSLAPLLGVAEWRARSLLRTKPDSFVWLARNVSMDAKTDIVRLGIRGIGVHNHQHRSYPHGTLAAHILGFVGADAQGLEGLERLFDSEILGTPATVKVCRDVHGKVFLHESDMAGVNQGATVRLTIDAALQSIAERELALRVEESEAKAGSVVVLDPRTGELLALANHPTFDPNAYGRSSVQARRNRAVTDLFDPGSTLKPMVVAAALEEGAVTKKSTFFCEEGKMPLPGGVIHDHKEHGDLDVAEILKVSSNICSYKIADVMGAVPLHAYLKRFGFGKRVGIGLPGEHNGLLRPPQKWRTIDLANISFGQGLSVTAVQLANAFAVLANGGMRMQPYVVERIVDADGTVIRQAMPTQHGRVVSESVASTVTQMLEAVVSEEGTAPQAMIEGLSVAGKTGTAQKVVDGRYTRSHWVSSFVGYFPAESPRVVIAVLIDEPQTHHYGGVIAGPVFQRIAEASVHHLGIDRLPDQPYIQVVDADPRPARQRVEFSFDGNMPDLHGMSLRAAMRALSDCDCEIDVTGSGFIIAQSPQAGTAVAASDAVSLRLRPYVAP